MSAFTEFDEEARLAAQSIEVLRRVGAIREIPFSMTVQGAGTMAGGDMDRAAVIWREALPLIQRCGDQWTESIVVYLLGLAEVSHKHYAQAKRWFAQSYTLYEKTGSNWGASFVLYQLSWITFDEGDYDEAERLLEAGLVHARKVHYLNNICIGLNGLSGVALAKSEFLQAKHFAEDALKISRDVGDKHMMFWTTLRLAEVATIAGGYDEARQHLRETLRMFIDLTEPAYVPEFGFVLIQFLARTNMRMQAVIVFSFLTHQPTWESMMPHEQKTITNLAAQMQSELPADIYKSAWQEGQILTLDDLLSKLTILL